MTTAPVPACWADIPAHIRARLEREGIGSLAAWRAAGRRRYQIFGIPTPLAKLIDALARGGRP